MTELLEQITASHYNKLEYFRLQTGCLFMEFLLAASRELTDSFLLEGDSTFTARSTKIIYDIMTFFQSEKLCGGYHWLPDRAKYGCNYDYINRLLKSHRKTMLAYLNELRISRPSSAFPTDLAQPYFRRG